MFVFEVNALESVAFCRFRTIAGKARKVSPQWFAIGVDSNMATATCASKVSPNLRNLLFITIHYSLYYISLSISLTLNVIVLYLLFYNFNFDHSRCQMFRIRCLLCFAWISIYSRVYELHLSLNEYSQVTMESTETFPGITTVHINGNKFSDWSEIAKLGKLFPNLQTLVMMENPVTTIETSSVKESFPR